MAGAQPKSGGSSGVADRAIEVPSTAARRNEKAVPRSAFALYYYDYREDLLSEWGGRKSGNVSFSLLALILGRRWQRLSHQDKSKYLEQARLERQKYAEEEEERAKKEDEEEEEEIEELIKEEEEIKEENKEENA